MQKYKNFETWQNAMKKDTSKKLWHDWFNIGGYWYTIEEYDESGKYMRLTSVTDGYHIDIETNNRYSPSWLKDATFTRYAIDDDLRFDIGYYLDDETLKNKSAIMLLNIWLWDRKMYKEMRDLIDLLATKQS